MIEVPQAPLSPDWFHHLVYVPPFWAKAYVWFRMLAYVFGVPFDMKEVAITIFLHGKFVPKRGIVDEARIDEYLSAGEPAAH